MKDRRKESRTSVAFPVEYSLEKGKNPFYTVSKNINTTGIEILSENSFSPGKQLKLYINFIDKVALAKAKVIWCQKEVYSERYRTGLKFLTMTEKNTSQLDSLISSLNQCKLRFYQAVEAWTHKMAHREIG
jgi:c-di-GMP-binding flagellar brake protein YcgR